MLLRLAGCYPQSIVKQSDFKALLGFVLGTTVEEMIELLLSQELIHMMRASKWLEEGSGMTNIQHFVQHNYQKQDGDPPLEHMHWDVLLLKRLKEVSHLDTEVGCMHRGHRDLLHMPFPELALHLWAMIRK